LSWIAAAAWVAAPAAFATELWAARRALAKKERVAEAWLCAGARPFEVLARLRGRFRPAFLLAMGLILPALVRPGASPPVAIPLGLAGIAAATVAASVFATARTFVDARLVDRAPPEARSPFRLRPYEAPAALGVWETRPPDDGSPRQDDSA
jgi:hypothetical protein